MDFCRSGIAVKQLKYQIKWLYLAAYTFGYRIFEVYIFFIAAFK